MTESTFENEGFLSEESTSQIKSMIDLEKDAFLIINSLNIISMSMIKNFPRETTSRNIVASTLLIRATQSFQASVILIERRFTSDIFHIIRTIQETYFAIAAHIKDEHLFKVMCLHDEYIFKKNTLNIIRSNPQLLKNYVSIISEVEKNSDKIKKQYEHQKREFEEESNRIIKNIPQLGVSQLFKITKDNASSQRIYSDYKLICNLYGHVSVNSMLNHFERRDNINILKFNACDNKNLHHAMTYLLAVFINILGEIDIGFFEASYKDKIIFLTDTSFDIFEKWETIKKG